MDEEGGETCIGLGLVRRGRGEHRGEEEKEREDRWEGIRGERQAREVTLLER